MTDAEKGLQQYVEFNANFERNYNNIVCAVEKHGRFWTPQAKPKGYEYGRMKMCYMNAYRATNEYGLRYVEGYATNIIPVQHAWNVDDEGNVIDLTWTTTGRSKYKRNVGALAYFGVEVPKLELDRILLRTGTYGAIWKCGGYLSEMHDEQNCTPA